MISLIKTIKNKALRQKVEEGKQDETVILAFQRQNEFLEAMGAVSDAKWDTFLKQLQ